METDNEAIYTQHAEAYRYQDALKWSRIKTAALIEGAVLYASWSNFIPEAIVDASQGFAFGLVFIVCLLALIDSRDAKCHLNAMREFEKGKTPEFTPRRCAGLGTWLLFAGLILLNLFNAYLIWCPVARVPAG